MTDDDYDDDDADDDDDDVLIQLILLLLYIMIYERCCMEYVICHRLYGQFSKLGSLLGSFLQGCRTMLGT